MFQSIKSRRIGLGLAAVVLVGVGTATGAAMTDPTATSEYAAVAEARQTAVEQRDDAREKYAQLQSDYETLESGIADREDHLAERQKDVEKAEAAVEKREKAVAKREKAVSGKEKEKAANTIHEGTWTVGVGIKPGTYRASEPVGSMCYWAILASGTNGQDIIANDLPGGGRPTVTLAAGQDFETSRCGTWERQ